MSKHRIITPGVIILTLILAALAGWTLVSCTNPFSSEPQVQAPQPLATPGDTNFTSVYAEDDLRSGDDVIVGDDATITGAASVGEGLTVTGAAALNGGLTMDSTAFTVANTSGNTSIAGTLTVAGVTTVAVDTEHIGLPTIDSVAVITTTNGALWTCGASEIWFIHALYCNVTTNFDCDGDDCIAHFGDGNDADGFLDLDDGELQAADTEGTGAPAGWQGFMSTDTVGAYLTNGLGFVYANDTIDLLLEDSSGHTDPTAGAATCYLIYTRIQ